MRKRGFMTIGYGKMNIYDFIDKVKKLRINCIIDVRTRPYSNYNISFNKEELRDRLADEGISYFWFGNKLGGKYDKIKYCDEKGRVDYEKVAKSEKFIDGIKELERLIDKYNICVMCSENNPMKCHRFLLVSRALKQYNIYHIMADFTLVKNSELEERLLKIHNGTINQLSLFDDSAEDAIAKAYREQGRRTSYVSQKVKDLLSEGFTEDIPEKTKIYCIGCENKTAEKFFGLLKEHKVKRIIDIRGNREDVAAFSHYPDISYHLKMHCISYERLEALIPQNRLEQIHVKERKNKHFMQYAEYITRNNSLLDLISDELDGTCFLGSLDDYRKCYRHVITKELRKRNANISVRHLR